MKKVLYMASIIVVMCAAVSCNKKKTDTGAGLFDTDVVNLAIDETFRPIMEEELRVFNARFPEAELHPQYVTETEALNMLLKDSIRLVLTTRELSEKEANALKAHKLTPSQQRIASDAIALVVNKNSTDSLITLDEIRGIMTGKITRWEQLSKAKKKGELQIVFDNQNSSTVRYIKDSICGKEPFAGNLKAQKTNSEVLAFIKENPNSIGVVGADWVKNPNDTSLVSFDPSVKVMLVSRFSGADASFVRPYQYNIATGEYPLTRGVYLIMTDPFSKSMTRNFYFFMRDMEGQLIITKNSQLLPYMPVQVKNVQTKSE